MTRKSPPNIVFILVDDLGYGDLNCYGADPRQVRTPNIDRLAREGIRFTDAHSPSSVCSPSRYNFMTGRYCWRAWAKTGCTWSHDPCLIEPDRPTIASVLRDGGYAAGMVGKWHLGFGAPGTYGGTRFWWAGAISEINWRGHHLFGPWQPGALPLDVHDNASGTAGEFGMGITGMPPPLGFDEAGPGDCFVKIGVGVLRRPDAQPYKFHGVYDFSKTTAE